MDLTASTTYTRQTTKVNTRGAASQADRRGGRPAGAVRVSDETHDRRTLHPGNLFLIALIMCGAVAWVANESNFFTPDAGALVQKSAHTPLLQPAFFFDDEQDALGSIPQTNPVSEVGTVVKIIRDTVNEEANAIANIIRGADEGDPDTTASIIRHDETEKDDAPENVFHDLRINKDHSVADAPLKAEVPAIDAVSSTTQNSQTVATAFAHEDQAASLTSPKTSHKPEVTQALLDAILRAQPDSVTDASETLAPTQTTEISNIAPSIALASLDNGLQQIPTTYQVTVAPGDTLSGILIDNGLSWDDMRSLLKYDLVKDGLSNIDIDQVFDIALDTEGNFQSLTTRLSDDQRVNINRTAAGFDVETIDLNIETRRIVASGSIDQSLFLTAEKAEIKQSTIMQLANIFQWDLDFERDIQKGDRFSLIYDKQFREGEYIGDGDILAAEFIRGTQSHVAIRVLKDDETTGYYSPDGNSKRRAFMRHPVDVVRITSRFDPNRLHPVLHQIRAHRGVDYGSPYGSPIYATADGRVIHAGDKGAYGKTVILKHGEKFSTLYAHMSRISNKSKVDARVKQGDVIGYVGKTGRVTGTHLHYEFRVNGTQIDPLEIELPQAQPLAEKYMPQLEQLTQQMSQLMLAAGDSADEQVISSNDWQAGVREN